jgi:phosphoglycerate dehydrogenase-like enzyme
MADLNAARTSPAGTKLLICVWHKFNLWRPPESLTEMLRGRWPEMTIVHLPNYEMLPAEISDTDIFVGYSIRPEQFALARRLKWIHSTATGIGQLMFPALRESGVVVTNARGVHSVPVAEHVMTLLLALARRLPDAVRFQGQAQWSQQEIWGAEVPPRELDGAVLLLVGFGAIGQEVARRAKAFGMTIRAVTRSGRGDGALAEKIFSAEYLADVLGQADFVVLAAPETPATTHMIGSRELAAMKRTAYLINVARGTLIDEPALMDALSREVIAGAALDVAENEPLPPENPLWRTKNLLITPHVAGVGERLWERQGALLAENLERWFSGREMLNLVDTQRGY